MKTITFILFVFVSICSAVPLTFEWNKSTSSNVTSYRLYMSSNGVMTATVPTTTTNVVWTNAVAGVAYAAWVTAVNTNGNTNVSSIESDPSDILEFTVPKAPAIFKLNAMNVHSLLEVAPLADGPFIPIYDFGSFPVVLADNQRFYRLRATIE